MSTALIMIPAVSCIVMESAAIREADSRFFAPRYCEIRTALAEDSTEKTIATIDTA